MKINIVLLITILIVSIGELFGQTPSSDPIVLSISDRFKHYNENKKEDELCAVGFALPYQVNIKGVERNTPTWEKTREERTTLYLEWIHLMLDAGLDLSFDLNDAKNSCTRLDYKYIGTLSQEEQKVYEQKKNYYQEICSNRKLSTTYQRVMQRFRFFYDRSFTQQGEGIAELEALIDRYCQEKGSDNKAQLLEAFQVGLNLSKE